MSRQTNHTSKQRNQSWSKNEIIIWVSIALMALSTFSLATPLWVVLSRFLGLKISLNLLGTVFIPLFIISNMSYFWGKKRRKAEQRKQKQEQSGKGEFS